MKKFTFICLMLGMASQLAWGQTSFKVINGETNVPANENDTVYFHCNSYSNSLEVKYESNSTYYIATILYTAVTNSPSGWTFNNSSSNQDLTFIKSSPQDGAFTVNVTNDPNDSHSFSHTINVYFKISPHFRVTSLASLGNNQSGSVTVTVDDATYNPYGPWTSINYTTTHNLQVHSSSSYNSPNPGGGASTDTQTLTTTGHGGRLYISASNACATSATKDYAVGTPYLASTTFNGSPGSSGTVSWVATLALLTDGTATNANWSITNGSGSISPSGTSCNAYPSSFLRVVGAPTNAFGTGEEATFYIWLDGYSPYRMAYPNPTKSTLTLDFDDALMAQELVNEIGLYNQKGKAVKQFDASKAADYFKASKSVTFDVRDLPSDTYFLHVRMGDKLFESHIVVE